jgi:hypothetical protein
VRALTWPLVHRSSPDWVADRGLSLSDTSLLSILLSLSEAWVELWGWGEVGSLVVGVKGVKMGGF